MINRFFVLIVLLTAMVFAQVPEKVHQKMSRTVSLESTDATPSARAIYTPVPSVFKVHNPAVGDTIGYTTFDYFANSLIRDQVAFYDGKVHISPMIRKWGSTKRTVAYITNNTSDNSYLTVQAFDSATGVSGYEQIDIQRTGTAIGTVAIVAHQTVSGSTVCRLGIWDGTSAFINSTFAPALDPSIQFSGDNMFLGTSGNRLEYQFLKSPDYGTTVSQWAKIGDFASTFFWKYNGSTELGIAKSRNEQYVVYYGGSRYASSTGTPAYNVENPDTTDNAWYLYSSDNGSTFTPHKTGISGTIDLIANRPLYAPLLCNFAQFDYAVANTGAVHAVFNGYSVVFNATKDTALANAFPMLYWNSTDKKFVAISDINIDTLSDIGSFNPGNSLGACYPSVAVSDDGKGVFAIWTGPEVTGGVLDTVGGNGFYWTDLYYAYSVDGGAKWTYGGTIPGANAKNVAEQYGTCAQFLEDNGTTWRAHILYEADLSSGIQVFSEGVLSNNPLVYKTLDIPKTAAGIKDIANGTKSFSLDQNYPNPFNPTTNINFSLGVKSPVSLKVYDMLGREVATLVNEELTAGSHSVSFDASKLTSGVYVYSLKAGNFSVSKKLTLVK